MKTCNASREDIDDSFGFQHIEVWLGVTVVHSSTFSRPDEPTPATASAALQQGNVSPRPTHPVVPLPDDSMTMSDCDGKRATRDHLPSQQEERSPRCCTLALEFCVLARQTLSILLGGLVHLSKGHYQKHKVFC
eukprot:1465695-Amphidinium_carterae.1